METKGKKKFFNIIMVALIVIVVGCGIMAIGSIKGWFGSNSESPVVSKEVKGVANIERSSIGYSLEADVPIKARDIIETKSSSYAKFNIGKKCDFAINESSEIEAMACDSECISLRIDKGELFGNFGKAPDNLSISADDTTITVNDSLLSVSKVKGSTEINVYSGEVCVKTKTGKENVAAGNKLMVAVDKNGKFKVEKSKLYATSLNDFQIGELQLTNSNSACFTSADLNKVIADRNAEKEQAAKALEQEAIAVIEQQQTSNGNTSDKTSSKSDKTGNNATRNIKTCTISIRCDTILKNMDKLKTGKSAYVPTNGIILATSSVQFLDGETAYDVTKRACSAAGIQIEASYTPVYGAYYVEGINHLYEFDCGDLSGWIYKVNGWAANYGASKYKLKDGDNIVWAYSCKGAGADVQ